VAESQQLARERPEPAARGAGLGGEREHARMRVRLRVRVVAPCHAQRGRVPLAEALDHPPELPRCGRAERAEHDERRGGRDRSGDVVARERERRRQDRSAVLGEPHRGGLHVSEALREPCRGSLGPEPVVVVGR
jgi:hypothetical protein